MEIKGSCYWLFVSHIVLCNKRVLLLVVYYHMLYYGHERVLLLVIYYHVLYNGNKSCIY